MKTKAIPGDWLARGRRRLDCGPYMSGALEVRTLLEAARVPKTPLRDLTFGGIAGLLNPGRYKRTWVTDRAHGTPFLSSSDILNADLSNVSLISNRTVRENPKLLIEEGWILITRSGSIGRMAYARPDMDGMACTEHVLRVIPDRARIPSGYLYAYLSSKFGVPLVVSGTYGAIIQHIEPEHIAALPVPRLGNEIEIRVHLLIEEAAELRDTGARLIAQGVEQAIEALDVPFEEGRSVSQFSTSATVASRLNCRLDAPYHSGSALLADRAIEKGPAPTERLADVVERYFKPPMFKRLWVDDPQFGRQFISGVDAYRYRPESIRFVSNGTPNFEEFILEEGMVIFQAAGQIYGLFGQPLYVSGWLTGLFAADDLYRLEPRTPRDGGYLFALLKTPIGQVLLKRQACGNSIPRVWDPHMRDIRIPWPDEDVRGEIGDIIIDAHARVEEARVAELTAVKLVEQAIEDAA